MTLYNVNHLWPVYNVNYPLPVYNVNCPLPVYNVNRPLPVYNVNHPLPVYNVNHPLPVYIVNRPLTLYNVNHPLAVYNLNHMLPVYNVKSIIDSLQCKLPIASWFACFLDILKYFNPIRIVQADLLYFLWVEFIWEFRRLIWLVARLNLKGRCSGRCYVNSTTFTRVIRLVWFQRSGM